MSSSKHWQYLKAMGIDVWVRRRGIAGVVPEQAAASASIPGASNADQPNPFSGAGAGAAPAPPVRSPLDPIAEGTAAVTESPALFPAAPIAAQAAPPASDEEWEALRSEVLKCTRCSLHRSRTQGVFGVGNRQAHWLVIGEAPGAEEDRLGEPFVGRAGQLLDEMLRAIGLSRATNVYIANVLKSRPPGNRQPSPEEVAACLPYLKRQIALLKPRLMLAVGRTAAQSLLETDVAMAQLRGKVHHFGELNIPLVVTYHPSYLLRSPSEKRKAWEDLKLARRCFQAIEGRPV